MADDITIDKAGRVVIPKRMRDALQIRPGDSLEITASEEQIMLRPARAKGRLVKERGLWVYYSGTSISPDEAARLVDNMREERIQSLIE